MSARTLPLLGVSLALAACQASHSLPAKTSVVHIAPTETAADAHRFESKPSAPVKVALAAKPLGNNMYAVTMTVTPTVAVASIELDLDGRRSAAGLTAAAEARTVTTIVSLGNDPGREIVGSASVPVGASHRRAAATIIVGEAPHQAEPPIQVVKLPDGSEAAEVRQ